MSNRLDVRTEKVAISSAGVSQVLTSSHVLTWSVRVYADATNFSPIFIGNDGNDTVSETTGTPLYPGDSITFDAKDFFSPYTQYINMSKIFVLSTGSGSYRLLYWVSAA